MKLSPEDLACLNCLCDDYEDVGSIKNQMEKELGKGIEKEDVVRALYTLLSNGLIKAYSYDVLSSRFILASGPESEKNWFLITEEGRKELDNS